MRNFYMAGVNFTGPSSTELVENKAFICGKQFAGRMVFDFAANWPRSISEDNMEQLEREIQRMLAMSDEERTAQYGAIGWKLLIQRYIELANDKITECNY